MIKLKILNVKDYDYLVEDTKNKTYNLNIEFYGLNVPLKVNDHIYVPEKIINEVNLYSYGPINNMDKNIIEEDLIKVVTDNNEFYLQRYYG